jgi:iron complex outermembrane receptor protein
MMVMAAGGAALAQATGVEQVVVTGTSIRGIAPVGSNLMSVSPLDIDATGGTSLQGVLSSVPALTNFGQASQGENNSSYFSVNIHQLGASASNSTLTLIDGHRAPLGDTNHALVDPNIIAPVAVERIEVLAEGASSVYGSDAVAGVVNIITRKRFDGIQLSGQYGFDSGRRTYNGSVLFGHSWSDGSALFAYSYSDDNALAFGSRGFLTHNHIPQGGTNFLTFNCSPATIQPNGAGNVYLSPTSTTSVANTAANSPCDVPSYVDILPRQTRSNVLAKVEQQYGKLTVGADFVYSNRADTSINSRGSVTATVFSTGTQANPF